MKGSNLLAASLIAAFATSAAAQELTLASGYPSNHGAHQSIAAFVEHVEANTDITVKVYDSGSLLGFGEIPGGLRDGVADVGTVLPPYYPSEFPDSNLAANLSMLTNVGQRVDASGAAMAGVMMEYIFNCPDCQQRYKEQNEVYLGSLSSATYDLLCKDPVTSIDDLKGRKFRVGAANFGRFVETYGGVQVAIPANEMYDAMAQGVVDCAVLSIADLQGYQMADVVDHVVLNIPGGVYSGVDPVNMNRETWQTLSQEQRQVLLEAGARAGAAATARFFNLAREVIDEAPSMGVSVSDATPEMAAATEAFVADDIPVIKTQFENDFGLKNVEQKIETITRAGREVEGPGSGLGRQARVAGRDLLERGLYRGRRFDLRHGLTQARAREG